MAMSENAARAERAEQQATETMRLYRLGLSSYRLIDDIPLLCETINDLVAALRRESERPAFRSELFEQLEGRHDRPE
jgi:hypothetical protein